MVAGAPAVGLTSLATRLGIRTAEVSAVALLFSLFLVAGLGRALTRSIAYAGFLARYPGSDIPYVYVVVGLVLSVLLPGYIWVAGRLSAPALAAGTMLALAVGEAALWLARLTTGSALVSLALPVWYESLSLMLALALWAVASHTLDVGQGRRLFGLIGAGFPFGYLVAGVATPLIVEAIGTTSLLALGALAFVVGAGVVVAVPRLRAAAGSSGGSSAGPAASPAAGSRGTVGGSPRTVGEPLGGLLRRRYVRLLLSMSVCWTLAVYVADYMFYERAAARYPVESELATFMGQYSAVMGIVSLLAGIAVTPRVLRRFGVRVSASVMPAAVGLTGLPILVIGTVAGGAMQALLWPAYVTKVGFYGFDSLDRVARSVLYQPLAPRTRLRVQALSEGLGGALTTSVVGLVLLVDTIVLKGGVVGASYLLAAVTACWFALSRRAGRAFPGELAAALSRRRLSGADLQLDRVGLAVLRASLGGRHPDVVLYALDRLQEAGDESIPELLTALLGHPAPAVRAEAVRRLLALDGVAALAPLLARLPQEQDPVVVGAIAAGLTAHGTSDDRDAVAALLGDPRWAGTHRVIEPAAVGLLRHGSARQRAAVRDRLRGWRADADPQVRLTAELVGATGEGDRRAWAAVAEALHERPLRQRASAALTGPEPAAAIALAAALDPARGPSSDPGGPEPARLITLSRVAGRVRAPGVARALAGRLATLDPAGLDRVVTDLGRSGWRPTADDPSAALLPVTIEQQAAAIARVLLLAQGLAQARSRDPVPASAGSPAALGAPAGPTGPAGLLSAALSLEHRRQLHRLLGLLALRDASGAVGSARRALPQHGPVTLRQRDYLIEVLDAVGERRLVPLVRTLLEPIAASPASPTSPGGPAPDPRTLPPPPTGLAADLAADPAVSRWSRTCATVWAAGLGAPVPSDPSEVARMLSLVERVIVLKPVSLFSRLPDDVLASIAEALREVELAPGENLFSRGQVGTAMYVVVAGSVRVHDGDHTISVLGEREVVGEMALLDDALRSASVSAQDEVLLLSLDRASLVELMEDHPQIAGGIIATLLDRLRARTDDVLAANRGPDAPPPG